VREALIRTRSKYISLIGALARREGRCIPVGPSPSFARRVEEAGLPAHTLAQDLEVIGRDWKVVELGWQ
jgi:hypothetical protein